jgi:DNA mismatch endonuclease (patch repair protein)
MEDERTSKVDLISPLVHNTDVFTYEKRSEIMSRVKSKDTKPELFVRSLLHTMGYRFRLHRKDLPGNPDIVLAKYRTVVFVHGCFWHQHPDCSKATIPKQNSEFWRAKLERNVERDTEAQHRLRNQGWGVLVLWECEVQREVGALPGRLKGNLDRAMSEAP